MSLETTSLPEAPNDEILFQAYVDHRDTVALGQLLERHRADLLRMLRYLLRDPHKAEDVVQDVAVKVLDKANQKKSENAFRQWVFGIARNRAFDQIRRSKLKVGRAVRLSLVGSSNEDGDTLLPELDRGETLKDDEIDQLKTFIQELPPELRAVLQARFFGELQFDQIATELGINISTAKTRVTRALGLLREKFKD